MEYIRPDFEVDLFEKTNNIITQSNGEGLTNIGSGGADGGSWEDFL